MYLSRLRSICGLLLVAGLSFSEPTSATSLQCDPVNPMAHDVIEGGYSFRAYSNVAEENSSGLDCLQLILKNHPGRTAVKVDWYLPASAGDMTLIGDSRLAGCLESAECDCDSIPCQLAREKYPLFSEPVPTRTTIDFGLHTRGRDRQGQADRTDPDVAARVIPPSTAQTSSAATSVMAVPEGWDYPPLTVHIVGQLSTNAGDVVPVDLYFVSTAIRDINGSFRITHNIAPEIAPEALLIAPFSTTLANTVDRDYSTAVIAWTAFEDPRADMLFRHPADSMSIATLADRLPLIEAQSVGIADSAEVIILYGEDIVLRTTAPAYAAFDQ